MNGYRREVLSIYFHAKNNYYFLKKVAEKFGGLK